MRANIILHRDFTVAPIDRRIYSAYLGEDERNTIFDPSHPETDEYGLRTDILDLLRAFSVPCVRQEEKKVQYRIFENLNQNFQNILLGSFADWCRKGGAELILSLPSGQGISHSLNSKFAQFKIKLRQLAREGVNISLYSFPYNEAGMCASDVRLSLMLGSENFHGATMADMVLRCGDFLDFVSFSSSSLHGEGEPAQKLEEAINALAPCLDRARRQSRKQQPISIVIDQWGQDSEDFLERALMLNVLIRHADRVRMAFAGNVFSHLAQLLTERGGMGWSSAPYDPMLAASVYGQGISLMPVIRGALLESQNDTHALDAAATLSPHKPHLTLFLVNRDKESCLDIKGDLHGFSSLRVTDHRLAVQKAHPFGKKWPSPLIEGRQLLWRLPPESYALVRLCQLSS